MKRIICFILCAAMLVGFVALPASAREVDVKKEWDGDPIVFLQGYSGPQLVKDRGLETEEFVWGINMDKLIPQVIKDVPMLVLAITLFAFGSDKLFIKQTKSVSDEILEPLTVNPDGTSKYNITPYPYLASEATAADLRAAGFGYMVPEDVISTDIMETVPEDKFYVFASDWRMGQVYNADLLDKFIDQVLAETGSDKVDIYGLSHGGQLGATYLFYYGLDGKVDNAVLNVPAIGGASMAAGLFDENGTEFDMETIVRFATIGTRVEYNLEWLAKLLPEKALNSILSTVMCKCFFDYVQYFGSVWDFTRPDDYDRMKAERLDPVKNAGVIAASDEMHYNVMANMGTQLRRVLASGTNIYIMSNCGVRMGTGEDINSDFIVDTASSSGAYVAPLGEHFADNYVQKNTACTNPAHNHISPSRDIDASTCYLPENTWFTYGQLHGQAWWDPYTRSMLLTMLLTDEITDIYSDPDYPQFEIAQNPKDFIYAKFVGESSGYVKAGDNKLVIENLSNEHPISLVSVKADGCTFDFNCLQLIQPGERIEINCEQLTEEIFFTLSISFIQYRPIPSALSRDFYFSAA